MKTLLTIIFAGVVSTAVAQLKQPRTFEFDRAGNEKGRGDSCSWRKKAADTVEDAIIPDSDTLIAFHGEWT
jgi:hypothetical protein